MLARGEGERRGRGGEIAGEHEHAGDLPPVPRGGPCECSELGFVAHGYCELEQCCGARRRRGCERELIAELAGVEVTAEVARAQSREAGELARAEWGDRSRQREARRPADGASVTLPKPIESARGRVRRGPAGGTERHLDGLLEALPRAARCGRPRASGVE